MKPLKIFLMVLILLIWGFVFFASANQIESKVIMVTINSERIGGITSKDVIREIYVIEDTAARVAESHEYNLHVFDCTDFSKLLVEELKKEGIKAECSAGYYLGETDYPRHTWVTVEVMDSTIEVEATSGDIIQKTDFKKNYIKKWGYCW